MSKPLILASGSPRRKKLLKQAGIQFKAVTPHVQEVILSSPSSTVIRNACLKARSVAKRFSDHRVLGTDTLVWHQGKTLGKPDSKKEAYQMLRSLNGRTHSVYSGLCLISKGRERILWIRTKVQFGDIPEKTLKAYADSGKALDKAGAYGIQEEAGVFIRGIKGDYFNVVGLPLNALFQLLETE